MILRRLGIFAGPFSLEGASAVVSGVEISPSDVVDCLADLTAKSLVAVEASGARYRLLDTMRVYALDRLAESGEREQIARRLAEQGLTISERAEAEWETRPTTEWLADYAWRIDNLRAALDWAFSPVGDTSIGVALTAASVPLWMQLSLMDECRVRVEQALAAIAAGMDCEPRREMKLHAALAASLTYAGGVLRELDAAWTKTLELAEQLDDAEYRLRAVWELWTLHRVSRWHCAALTQAERYCALAANRADPNHRLIGERMLGISYHYSGDQVLARPHLEGVLAAYVEAENRSHIVRFQVDLRVSARTFLAPVLWLLGFPDRAIRAAEAAIEEARAANHALSLSHALVFGACPTALLAGDLASGKRFARMLIDHSAKHGLARWHAYASGYRGALLIRRGDIAAGLQLLRAGVDELGGFTTLRFMDLLMPEALHRAGEIVEGLASVDEAIARSEETKEYRLTPELLRIKGELLLLQGGSDASSEAEDLFRQALDGARHQQTLSWELRAAISLGRLLRDQRRSGEGFAVLQPIYDRFVEGFDTADLKTARSLLDVLGQNNSGSTRDALARRRPVKDGRRAPPRDRCFIISR